MRKVLIIGFLWPYIGGSKRVIGLANYLSEFGWEPIVLTAPLKKDPPRNFRVVETDYSGLLGAVIRVVGLSDKLALGDQLKERVRGLPAAVERVLRWGFDLFREIVAYPDEHKRWNEHAIAAAEEIIKKESVEGMISVWPVTSHVIARELKTKHGVPWIADLADLWSDNSAYPYGRIRKWFDRRLERRTLKDADVLTTSSGPLAERLSRLHGGRPAPAIIIGFDPRIVNQSPAPLRQRFTITYTGVFYRGKRDPYVFFHALEQLLREQRIDGSEIEVRLYGPDQGWIRKEIEDCGVSAMVRQYKSVSYEECVERQRESHLLLQVNWNDVNEKGVFSGKLLDYLAAGRPILAVGGSGNDEVVIKILRETKAGVYAVTVDEIKNALERFCHEYHQTGTVKYRGDWNQIGEYSSRAMARAFGRLLDEVAGRMPN